MNFKDITLADVSVETKVETLGVALDSKVTELEQSVSSVTKQIGPVGPKGEQGDRGPAGIDGKDGRDGLNGSDGKDGKDGIDGDDGKDGVSVVDANIAADNSLVLTLSDGSEIDAGVIDTGLGGTSYVNLGRAPAAGGGGGGGAVDSVNGLTGTVVLTASSVGAEPANATILKSAAIGVTVQGYNANTVVDASYVHTDNNYTTTEKTKLSGIAAGAEVNVNADWNATTGDAQILNKPTLFSGAYADLTGKPTLGTAAAASTTDFATAAQGTLASTALQSYTETDPVYVASSWYTTTNNSSNWNTAYGWGNHASAGYLLSTTAGTTYVSLTGSYADPTWITSIAGSKVSGNISGNAANITGTYAGTITSSQVTTALGYTPYNSTNPNGYTSNVGTVTNVTANGVLSVATGTTTPAISISQATTSTSGYLSSTDWNTFNNKQPAGSYITSGGALGTPSSGTLTNCTSLPVGGITATGTPSSTTYLRGDGTWSTITGGSGTVTSVAALTLGTTGTDLSSTVANSTTTPVITLNVPTASATNRGALSSTDWSTFNGKQDTLVSGTSIKTVNGLSLLGSGDISSFLARSTSVFTTGSSQTYTAPAGTEWVKVTVVGPGGNGGAATNQRATGGGGGAVSIKGLAMTAGQTLTYTVGTASGTASTVSSGTLTITTISAGSGANGAGTAYAASLTAGPAGGTATGGGVNIAGGKGGNSYGSGTTVTTNFSGAGGSCQFGQGGPALALVATAGQAGTGFGAGGGGAHGSNTAANGTGGVIIFEAY